MQLKELSAVKNAAELDGLFSAYGIELTGDEKAKAFTYFSTGKQALSEDDLDMVTGGAVCSPASRNIQNNINADAINTTHVDLEKPTPNYTLPNVNREIVTINKPAPPPDTIIGNFLNNETIMGNFLNDDTIDDSGTFQQKEKTIEPLPAHSFLE